MILADRNRKSFESYMRNEQPLPIEIAGSPRIDMWKSVVSTQSGEPCIRLEGEIYSAPEYRDGERIRTSPLIWIDRAAGWARTMSRLYRLDGAVIEEDVET